MSDKLQNILKLNGRGILKKIDEDLHKEIISLTLFLPLDYPIGARIYCIKNSINKLPTCKCGKSLIYRSGKFTKTCGGKECIKKETRIFFLEKYGTDHIFKDRGKMKAAYLKKYGVDNPSKSEEIKNKSKQTNLRKYGVENPFQSEKIKEGIKKTNLRKYGVDWYISSNEYKIKIKKSFKDRREKQLNDLLKGNYFLKDEKTVIYTCPKCHKSSELNLDFLKLRIYRYNVDICIHCNPKNLRNSGKEVEITDWLSSLNIQFKRNYRLKNNKEIDIYIPSKNFGIEFNGLFWHSELFKDKNYHIDKLESANKEGIHLIFIWEDDWNDKKEIIKSIIKNRLGLGNRIYARNTEVHEIKKGLKNFLESNHLQGFIPSSVNLGLYHNNELVSCMTFGRRKNKYEMLRFCSKIDTNIIGGASKLFKYLLNNFSPNEDIISYANTDISEGHLYELLGFHLNGKTSPGYWWGKGNKKFNRVKFQKYKLIREGEDKNLTEEEIMHKRGYFKIYNTGNFCYKYIIKR
jgi:hypothetical protein